MCINLLLKLAKQMVDAGGPGVIADLGSHIIGMARFLLGDIAEVSADVRTVIKQRPVARGSSDMKPVLVDDVAHILVNFGRGCGGTGGRQTAAMQCIWDWLQLQPNKKGAPDSIVRRDRVSIG